MQAAESDRRLISSCETGWKSTLVLQKRPGCREINKNRINGNLISGLKKYCLGKKNLVMKKNS